MNETEMTICILKYLLKKGHVLKIYGISYGRTTERLQYEDFRRKNKLNFDLFHNNQSKSDIRVSLDFETSRKQKDLMIEVKGKNKRDIFYNFYTLLGQFLCKAKRISSYYWYGLGVPYSWKDKIKDKFKDNELIEKIYKIITKNGQGMYFYFVDDSGDVEEINFSHFIT